MSDVMQARALLVNVIMNGTAQEAREFAANCSVVRSLEQLRIYANMISEAIGEYDNSSRLALTERQRANLRILTQAIFAPEVISQLDQRVEFQRRRTCASRRKRFEAANS